MHTTKISDEQVRFIKDNKGIIKADKLAEMFNLNRGSIYRIQNNRSRYVTA